MSLLGIGVLRMTTKSATFQRHGDTRVASQGTPRTHRRFLFRRPSDVLFMGRRSVFQGEMTVKLDLTRYDSLDVCYNFVYKKPTTVRIT